MRTPGPHTPGNIGTRVPILPGIWGLGVPIFPVKWGLSWENGDPLYGRPFSGNLGCDAGLSTSINMLKQ